MSVGKLLLSLNLVLLYSNMKGIGTLYCRLDVLSPGTINIISIRFHLVQLAVVLFVNVSVNIRNAKPVLLGNLAKAHLTQFVNLVQRATIAPVELNRVYRGSFVYLGQS